MTLIAQMDCCTQLGIGPKTLRNWLRHASMQFCTHPIDARLKCLTQEQVQQLATLHARPLQIAPDPSPVLPDETTPLASSPADTAVAQKNKAPLISVTSSLLEEVELRKAVHGLEAKVLTLQEHLTQLTIELLRERSERYEQRLSALEAHARSSSSAQELVPLVEQRPHSSPASPRPLQPAELLARSRILPRRYPSPGMM
jgi:hypothetical protein